MRTIGAAVALVGLAVLATNVPKYPASGLPSHPKTANSKRHGAASGSAHPTTTIFSTTILSTTTSSTTTSSTTTSSNTSTPATHTRLIPPTKSTPPSTVPAAPPPSSTTGPPLAGSWSPLLADDFAGNSLNSAVWTTCYLWNFAPAAGCTNFGNAELEWYMPSQDQVSGGALHLVAQRTPTSGEDANGQPLTYPWTSGVVTTQDHVDFTYGYIQVVARIPKGDGFWPALWLLPLNGWPPEIDIMENFGNDTSNVYLTNHPVGAPQQELIVNTGTDLSTAYHTFAVDWEPGAITWYLDGQAKYTVTSGVPSVPMYFIANLAIDGTPGRANPDASTPSSASFDIKSVEIWQHKTSS